MFWIVTVVLFRGKNSFDDAVKGTEVEGAEMRTNEELMDAFSCAWTGQNLDEIVGLFAKDGVFNASSSFGNRQRACGHDEIRRLTKGMFETDDGAMLKPADRVLFEGGAFCRWQYILPSGSIQLGCDFFQIENGLVTLKDAYRKIGPIVGSESQVA